MATLLRIAAKSALLKAILSVLLFQVKNLKALNSSTIKSQLASLDWKRHPLFIGLIVAAGYYVGAFIGFELTLKQVPISLMWPPNSILLSALLILPPAKWKIIFIAALPVHFLIQMQSGVPLLMACAWFVTNCCEALIGAVVIQSLIHRKLRLDSYRDTCIFIGSCAFLGPFLSSFLDVTLVTMIGWGNGSYWELWSTRFFSNVLTVLAIVPVFLSWGKGIIRLGWEKISVGNVRSLSGIAVLGAIAFIISVPQLISQVEMLVPRHMIFCIPFLALLWGAVMFHTFAVSLAFLCATLLATWGMVNGTSPFVAHSPHVDALSVQFFLICIGITVLLLSSAIEERRRTHEALRAKEESLHVALAAAKMGTWQWDLLTNKIELSPESIEMFGLNAEADNSSLDRFLELIHQDDRDKTLQSILSLLEGGLDFEVDFRIVRPDGKIKWISGKGEVKRDPLGKPIQMIGVNVDVTERKFAMAAVRRAENSEKNRMMEIQGQRAQLRYLTRTAMLGELSGALAHELNQPLTAILSNAQAARRFMDKDAVNLQEVREILDDIINDDKRAAEIIRRLRALFIKGNAMLEEFDLNQQAYTAIEIFNSYLVTKNIRVIDRLHKNLPRVNGDIVQFQQVLINLILNACEAMNDSTLEKREITLESDQEKEGEIWLAISDTGGGIPPNILHKLFDSFFTTKVGGMGFGLSISRTIVAEHNGHIEAMNNTQGGATFKVTLPCN